MTPTTHGAVSLRRPAAGSEGGYGHATSLPAGSTPDALLDELRRRHPEGEMLGWAIGLLRGGLSDLYLSNTQPSLKEQVAAYVAAHPGILPGEGWVEWTRWAAREHRRRRSLGYGGWAR